MQAKRASVQIYQYLAPLFDSNVYPLIKPESEEGTPYAVYTILNTNPENSIDGYLGHELAYIQLDIYAYNYDICEDLATQSINTLQDNIQPFHYESKHNSYEQDTGLFRQSIECYMWQQN